MNKYLLLLLVIPSLSFADKKFESALFNCETLTVEGQCVLLCSSYYKATGMLITHEKCHD